MCYDFSKFRFVRNLKEIIFGVRVDNAVYSFLKKHRVRKLLSQGEHGLGIASCGRIRLNDRRTRRNWE